MYRRRVLIKETYKYVPHVEYENISFDKCVFEFGKSCLALFKNCSFIDCVFKCEESTLICMDRCFMYKCVGLKTIVVPNTPIISLLHNYYINCEKLIILTCEYSQYKYITQVIEQNKKKTPITCWLPTNPAIVFDNWLLEKMLHNQIPNTVKRISVKEAPQTLQPLVAATQHTSYLYLYQRKDLPNDGVYTLP